MEFAEPDSRADDDDGDEKEAVRIHLVRFPPSVYIPTFMDGRGWGR